MRDFTGDEAVLLVHGLGGTRNDLGNLRRKLATEGRQIYDLLLPGHGGRPDDLRDIDCEVWIDAVQRKVSELRRDYTTVHVLGLCMGALLALETAKRGLIGANGRDRLVLLAPPVFLDGWSLPWYRAIRHLVYRIPLLAQAIRIRESFPFGVKNRRVRGLVERKLRCDESFHYSWVPLRSIRELDRLRTRALVDIERVACPTLIVHSIDDELTSVRSAQTLRDRINSGRNAPPAQLRILSDSYHMICIDNERDHVAGHVKAFLAPVQA
ncbi:alpha/beta fold hydrolase [Paraburkholderia guartelaensis]|uniref:Alpha/beta fold hydrolase n=2 Tax=Paraburkholderia guartelaensis TaxID=2546446 RepID=A0A4R5LMT0_9BURK|nr:alpha/beta fold hydrolase [Paraburkholderia guartelaensis]